MTISHLTGGYRGTAVVKDLSLTLPRGEITALVGPNGCGKTTLLRLCGRLLRPMAGTIRLPDSSGTQRDIAAFSPKEFARLAAVLPQVRAVPSLPVGALVAHGRFPHLAYPRRLSGEDRRLVRQAMEAAGIWELRDANVAELSGGQRQKAYIAMALAQGAAYLFLDEPTTYLDLRHQYDILARLREQRDAGKAVVMVLHDLSQALAIADRVAVMAQGRLVAVGTPREIADGGTLDEAFGVRCVKTRDEEGREGYAFYPRERE